MRLWTTRRGCNARCECSPGVLLWRADGDRAEFITMSLRDSRAAIEGFAGQDIEQAVLYPEDDHFLIDRDLVVRHYEVAGFQ
jgi:hypothetical protein